MCGSFVNSCKHILFHTVSRGISQGTSSQEVRSATSTHGTTNTSPTPTLELVPEEQEEETNVTILIITISAVITMFVLLMVVLVIGIVILRRKRRKCSIPNATSHYEFETTYDKGIYIIILIRNK